MLLVLLELENSLNNAVKMEQAKVCYKKKEKRGNNITKRCPTM